MSAPLLLLLLLSTAAPAATLSTSAELLSFVRAELGPNRLVCSPDASQRIEIACEALIESSGARPSFPKDLMTLDGDWRLVYSSAFAAPFAPPQPLQDLLPLSTIDALPLVPSGVAQKIDVTARRVVNVVQLAPFSGPADGLLASLPGVGSAVAALRAAAGSVRLELDHKFSVEGEGGSGGGARRASAGSVVELQLDTVRRAVREADGEGVDDDVWVDMLNPQVRKEVRAAESASSSSSLLFGLVERDGAFAVPEALGAIGAGAFDTPFVDGRVRISRGLGAASSAAGLGGLAGGLGGLAGGGELRIFERVGEAEGAAVYSSWQEEEDALAAAAAAGEASAEGLEDRWQEGGLEEAEAMDFYEPGADGMPDS